jgi:hypothetical protein
VAHIGSPIGRRPRPGPRIFLMRPGGPKNQPLLKISWHCGPESYSHFK